MGTYKGTKNLSKNLNFKAAKTKPNFGSKNKNDQNWFGGGFKYLRFFRGGSLQSLETDKNTKSEERDFL